jgi:nucleoid-associated protein Lsr2
MAQTQIIELIDDLHGGPATQTVDFTLDGTPYQIDLDDPNAGRLREALAPYLVKARWTGGRKPDRKRITAAAEALEQRRNGETKRGRGKAAKTPPAPLPQFTEPTTTGGPKRPGLRPDAAHVRAWAASQGIDLNPRGRIPQHVTDQFLASQSKRQQ